ncbi:MAG: VOC family protein [Chloroflexota bacterium]
MTIRYKLHHVGLLCEDSEKSTQFYRDVLGHEVTARFFNTGRYDLTFVGSGSDLLLELIGPPFGGDEQTFFEQRGSGMHHLAFEVEDVDAAFADLTAKGIRVAWEPDDFLFVRHCGVYDDNGIVIEILQELEPLARPGLRGLRANPDAPDTVDYHLHHFDIFSDNWQRTKQFYADYFGFQSLFEYIYKKGGAFIYLADPFFNADTRQAMIEVIGPPYEEPREFLFSEQFGTGMDHIGYVVKDVGAAYNLARTRGSSNLREPYQDYGTEMCWVQDADNNDLELMKPVSKAELQKAFDTGVPYYPPVVV